MPIAIREKVYKDKIMREAEKMKNKKGDEAAYKASGGNVAGYYNRGGGVTGCGKSQNKPYSN